jgi:opacity protein-like surface antigen
MIMKLKTLLLTTALVASSAFADAPAPSEKKHVSSSSHTEGYYLKVEAGATKPRTAKANGVKSKFKTKFVAGLGGGYKFNDFFRSDLMLQYRGLQRKGAKKINTYSAMLNGYVDGHNDTIFTPYLMAGVGATTAKGKAEKRATKFSWNAGLGAQAKVHDQATVDLGYRYVNIAKLKKSGSLKAHEVVAGLIWNL